MTRLTLGFTLTDNENDGTVLWQAPYLEFDHDMNKPLGLALIIKQLYKALNRTPAK